MQRAKKAAFLAAFVEDATITHAARRVGMDRVTHYRWLESDPEYAAAFREAERQAIDLLEREARRRAIEGVEKPVYQGGQQVGTIREYSDTLLIFLLKGAVPSKYRERVEVTLDVRGEAQRLAGELGLDAETIIAEAERIVAEARS